MPPAHDHRHAVMTGWVVRPYDVLVAGLVMRGRYRGIARAVASAVPDGGAVVDVGTGPGRLLLELAARRPDLHLTGIDPSADMLGRARRHATIWGLPSRSGAGSLEFVQAAAEDIPLPDDSCDAVVSSLSSHHWADVAAAVAEQARVLRPGGRLWVVDLRGRMPSGIAEQLQHHGLTLRRADLSLGWLSRRLQTVAAEKPLSPVA